MTKIYRWEDPQDDEVGDFYEDYEKCVNEMREYMSSNYIIFESEEKAREAIKVVGEDRVKKYILGVTS